MVLEISSPCKVNLLLNILERRPDGFHELETIMQPVAYQDRLTLRRGGHGIELTCSVADLPTDHRNLVYRAAQHFQEAARIPEGVCIHLEKRIPLAAGLGGGSGNAAATLQGLNRLFDRPLSEPALLELAAALGSDVPFFLHNQPALATGRGEHVEPLPPFPALRGCHLLLAHPGFGVSTAWAYQRLARFPTVLPGQPGRARHLLSLLQYPDPDAASRAFYNSLEIPVFEKYPVLELLKEFLLENGAVAALMSGSGSTVFAILRHSAEATALEQKVRERFQPGWTAVVPLQSAS